MSAPYDPQNIFAKILRGEASCVAVDEDDVSLSFMDIMPRADGHVLVIPKIAARNLIDIGASELSQLMPSVQRVTRGVKTGMAAEGIIVAQYNESASGQMVFHLHFHILPCWSGVALRPPGGPIVAAPALEVHAARIRAALAAG